MKYTSLVTGGAGFIGSHVVKNLISLGHHVIVLDDLSGGVEENIFSDVQFVRGSVVDTLMVNQLFKENDIDYVYHLAAYAAEGLSHFIRKFNYENNVMGSINLINAAVNNNLKHFVFISSIAVYGTGQLPLTEDQNPQPEDPYGIAKYTIELDLKNANKLFGLNYTIFRPHNVYGPHQNINDPYRNVIGIFMNKLLKEEDLPVFGDGNQKRAFTYIDDVASYIAQSVIMEAACNEIFNIGSDEIHSINELVRVIGSVMDKNVSIQYLPQREEVVESFADLAKYNHIFQPYSSTSLEYGLQKMAQWVTNNFLSNESTAIAIEVEKNLPDFWKKTMS